MVRETKSALEQTLGPDIVHVAAVTESQLDAFVLRPRISDSDRRSRGDDVVGNQQVDRLEDLRVPGAAAQVRSKPALDGLLVEVASLLIHERLGADEDSGRAEAALESAGRGEGIGEAISFFNLESLEGRDGLAFSLLHGDEAALDRLAIEQDRARPALSGWRAAILGGGDAEFFAQDREEVRMTSGDFNRESVDGERSSFHR